MIFICRKHYFTSLCFRSLTEEQLGEVLDAMFEKPADTGETIITQVKKDFFATHKLIDTGWKILPDEKVEHFFWSQGIL